MKTIVIDFEYNNSAEPFLNLVCVSWKLGNQVESLWLEGIEENKQWFKNWLLEHKSHPFVAFNVVAEAQSFIALGLDPREFQWIDIQIEYKMLLNSDHTFEYGKHKIGGKIVNTRPPINPYDVDEEFVESLKTNYKEAGITFDRPSTSLVSAFYKLCGQEIDSERKDEMRDLIIAGGPFSESNKREIMEYCESDVINLHKMLAWFNESKFMKYKKSELLWRGRTAANCAVMSSRGYPVDVEKIKTLRKNMPKLEKDLIDDINSQFDFPFFHYIKAKKGFAKNVKGIKEKLKEQFSDRLDHWPKTAKGDISLSSDALKKMFEFKHTYPRNNVAAQYSRFISFESSLKSMKGKDKEKDFLRFVGSDGRVRAWLNPYGAQTGRYQPPSTQFLFLKTAWMRSLCCPPKGKVIIGIDYGSQEFLLQAALSEDAVMYESYLSGDVYMDFGKKSGLIPPDATKETAKKPRAVAKAALLGIGYGMGPTKLGHKITDDSGQLTTTEQAKALIDAFKNTYYRYSDFKKLTMARYKKEGELSLPDGWVMWKDNDSKNSILNFPVQGLGSCIMRKAVDLSLDAGLEVLFPLHDALYIESDIMNYEHNVLKLAAAMREASGFYLKGTAKEWARNVRLDCDVWGEDVSEGFNKIQDIPIKLSKVYIDERALEEYEQFSKYFYDL